MKSIALSSLDVDEEYLSQLLLMFLSFPLSSEVRQETEDKERGAEAADGTWSSSSSWFWPLGIWLSLLDEEEAVEEDAVGKKVEHEGHEVKAFVLMLDDVVLRDSVCLLLFKLSWDLRQEDCLEGSKMSGSDVCVTDWQAFPTGLPLRGDSEEEEDVVEEGEGDERVIDCCAQDVFNGIWWDDTEEVIGEEGLLIRTVCPDPVVLE